jgi:hypothetical protein
MPATNTFLPPKVFANAGLKFLKNNLVMAKRCDSEGVDKAFKPGVGGTVYVKRPPEFIVRRGATAAPQNTVEGELAVNCNIQSGVDVQFTSIEETLNVDALLKSRVLSASMATIASDIDGELQKRGLEFANWVGTPGTTMSSATALTAAAQRLDEGAVPADSRVGVLSPADGFGVTNSILGLASQQGEVAKNALQKAQIPIIGDIDWYKTQTIASLTTGTRAVTGTLVNGAAQNVAYTAVKSTMTQSLICDGQVSKTYKAGESFTIAGVFAINPRTKASLPYLKQFAILADAASDGSGNVTLTISPAIISDNTSPYQNVSAAPADNAAMTHLGALSTTFQAGAAFHPTAIKLVSAKLIMPYTGEADYATDPDTGLTVRYWRYSDGASDTHNHRWDVLFGTVNADQRLGTRVSG